MRVLQQRVFAGAAAVRALFAHGWTPRVLAGASLVLVALTAFLPWWRAVPQEGESPFVPLHYNVYFGIDRFGPWQALFLPAAIGLAVLLVNVGMQAAFRVREKMLAQFFAWATLAVEAVLLVAVAFMVLLTLS